MATKRIRVTIEIQLDVEKGATKKEIEEAHDVILGVINESDEWLMSLAENISNNVDSDTIQYAGIQVK